MANFLVAAPGQGTVKTRMRPKRKGVFSDLREIETAGREGRLRHSPEKGVVLRM
jgi:hypothetical protein